MSWAFTVADEEYDKETRTRIIKRIKKSMMCQLLAYLQRWHNNKR